MTRLYSFKWQIVLDHEPKTMMVKKKKGTIKVIDYYERKTAKKPLQS